MIPFYFTLGFSKALKSFRILFNFNSSIEMEDRPFSYFSHSMENVREWW